MKLSAYRLKLIALTAMTLDHIGLWGWELTEWAGFFALRAVGRLAAPVFLFLLTESLRHTHSRARLLARLFVGALLHAAISYALIRLTGRSAWYGNMFYTFFCTALVVTALENARRGRPALLLAAAVFLTAGLLCGADSLPAALKLTPVSAEYSVYFILLGVLWYFLEERRAQALLFGAFCLCFSLLPSGVLPGAKALCTDLQPCMALALPLLLLYDGTRGAKRTAFFYFYYPLHQYALLLAACLLFP